MNFGRSRPVEYDERAGYILRGNNSYVPSYDGRGESNSLSSLESDFVGRSQLPIRTFPVSGEQRQTPYTNEDVFDITAKSRVHVREEHRVKPAEMQVTADMEELEHLKQLQKLQLKLQKLEQHQASLKHLAPKHEKTETEYRHKSTPQSRTPPLSYVSGDEDEYLKVSQISRAVSRKEMPPKSILKTRNPEPKSHDLRPDTYPFQESETAAPKLPEWKVLSNLLHGLGLTRPGANEAEDNADIRYTSSQLTDRRVDMFAPTVKDGRGRIDMIPRNREGKRESWADYNREIRSLSSASVSSPENSPPRQSALDVIARNYRQQPNDDFLKTKQKATEQRELRTVSQEESVNSDNYLQKLTHDLEILKRKRAESEKSSLSSKEITDNYRKKLNELNNLRRRLANADTAEVLTRKSTRWSAPNEPVQKSQIQSKPNQASASSSNITLTTALDFIKTYASNYDKSSSDSKGDKIKDSEQVGSRSESSGRANRVRDRSESPRNSNRNRDRSVSPRSPTRNRNRSSNRNRDRSISPRGSNRSRNRDDSPRRSAGTRNRDRSISPRRGSNRNRRDRSDSPRRGPTRRRDRSRSPSSNQRDRSKSPRRTTRRSLSRERTRPQKTASSSKAELLENEVQQSQQIVSALREDVHALKVDLALPHPKGIPPPLAGPASGYSYGSNQYKEVNPVLWPGLKVPGFPSGVPPPIPVAPIGAPLIIRYGPSARIRQGPPLGIQPGYPPGMPPCLPHVVRPGPLRHLPPRPRPHTNVVAAAPVRYSAGTSTTVAPVVQGSSVTSSIASVQTWPAQSIEDSLQLDDREKWMIKNVKVRAEAELSIIWKKKVVATKTLTRLEQDIKVNKDSKALEIELKKTQDLISRIDKELETQSTLKKILEKQDRIAKNSNKSKRKDKKPQTVINSTKPQDSITKTEVSVTKPQARTVKPEVSINTAQATSKPAPKPQDPQPKQEGSKPNATSLVSNQDTMNVQILDADAVYNFFDGGNHQCVHCDISFSNLSGFLQHIDGKRHKKIVSEEIPPWQTLKDREDKEHLNKLAKTYLQNDAKTVQMPLCGTEYMFSLSGYFCQMCEKFLYNSEMAERHLFSEEHNLKVKGVRKTEPEKQAVIVEMGKEIQSTEKKTIEEYSQSKLDKKDVSEIQKTMKSANEKTIESIEKEDLENRKRKLEEESKKAEVDKQTAILEMLKTMKCASEGIISCANVDSDISDCLVQVLNRIEVEFEDIDSERVANIKTENLVKSNIGSLALNCQSSVATEMKPENEESVVITDQFNNKDAKINSVTLDDTTSNPERSNVSVASCEDKMIEEVNAPMDELCATTQSQDIQRMSEEIKNKKRKLEEVQESSVEEKGEIDGNDVITSVETTNTSDVRTEYDDFDIEKTLLSIELEMQDNLYKDDLYEDESSDIGMIIDSSEIDTLGIPGAVVKPPPKMKKTKPSSKADAIGVSGAAATASSKIVTTKRPTTKIDNEMDSLGIEDAIVKAPPKIVKIQEPSTQNDEEMDSSGIAGAVIRPPPKIVSTQQHSTPSKKVMSAASIKNMLDIYFQDQKVKTENRHSFEAKPIRSIDRKATSSKEVKSKQNSSEIEPSQKRPRYTKPETKTPEIDPKPTSSKETDGGKRSTPKPSIETDPEPSCSKIESAISTRVSDGETKLESETLKKNKKTNENVGNETEMGIKIKFPPGIKLKPCVVKVSDCLKRMHKSEQIDDDSTIHDSPVIQSIKSTSLKNEVLESETKSCEIIKSQCESSEILETKEKIESRVEEIIQSDYNVTAIDNSSNQEVKRVEKIETKNCDDLHIVEKETSANFVQADISLSSETLVDDINTAESHTATSSEAIDESTDTLQSATEISDLTATVGDSSTETLPSATEISDPTAAVGYLSTETLPSATDMSDSAAPVGDSSSETLPSTTEISDPTTTVGDSSTETLPSATDPTASVGDSSTADKMSLDYSEITTTHPSETLVTESKSSETAEVLELSSDAPESTTNISYPPVEQLP